MNPVEFDNLSVKVFRKKLLLSMVIPGIFVVLIAIIRFIEVQFELDMAYLGIFPQKFKGLPGIILSPLIHDDINHLMNNSLPVFVLGTAIFYFYSEVAFRVTALTWFITGGLVWLAGRDAWHIGASGLVYGFASFLFISGIIRRYFRLLALSMLVVYLYGSMVWGMFPLVYVDVSWESHMLGAVTGLFLAVVFRNQGPQKPEPDWGEDGDVDEDESYYISKENDSG